jgi:TolA-binding protein
LRVLRAKRDHLLSLSPSPTASRASPPTPSSNHSVNHQVQAIEQRMQVMQDGLQAWSDRVRNLHEKFRQFQLEQLREDEHELNKRAEDLKSWRQTLRMYGIWDGELKADVGWEIMEIALEKRDVKEKIKELEDAAKDI